MSNLISSLNPTLLAVLLIIVPAVILYGMHLFFRRYTSAWENEERGFSKMKTHWHKAFYVAFITGEASSILAGILSGWNVYAVIIFAILGYALSFSSYTDIIEHKAPKEIARYSIILLIPVAAVAILDKGLYLTRSNDNILLQMPYLPVSPNIQMQQLVSFGIWMLIPVIMLIVSGGGLGMADIRLFVLFGVGLSWWVGIMGMFAAFFIANLIQVLTFIPAKKFNWGHMVTLKSGKQKRAMPFIPALSASFMVVAFYMVSHVFN